MSADQPSDIGPPPSGLNAEKRRVLSENNLSALWSEFAAAIEWGVFSHKKSEPKSRELIQEKLLAAEEGIAAQDWGKVDASLLDAKVALIHAESRRPIWFLANTRFGFLPILLTFVSSVGAYYFIFIQFLKMETGQSLQNAGFLGLSGAILKSLYWLQYQINKGLLRPRWFAYFIVAPFVGVLLGNVTSLLAKTGFKLLGAGQSGDPDWRMVGFLAIFAGFNWEWALERFRYGAEALAARLAEKRVK